MTERVKGQSHRHRTVSLRLIVVLVATALLVAACDNRGKPPAENSAAPVPTQLNEEQREQLTKATQEAWQLAEAPLEQAHLQARKLHQQVANFLEQPSADTLEQAQNQWRGTALAFQPLRLYLTLAEIEPGLSALRKRGFNIAAKPIQPGYLDSIGIHAYSGLVHDISLPITAETLRDQHGLTSEEDASLGLFALEFMLFGAGDAPRTAADYLQQQQISEAAAERGFTYIAALPENRRRQLLRLQSELLVADLQQLEKTWRDGTESELSLYQIYVTIPPAQRRALLLHSAQLELAEILVELGEQVASATGDEGAEKSAEAESAAAQLPPATPLQFFVARLTHLTEVVKTLQVDEQLPQQLQTATDLLAAAGSVNEPLTADETQQIRDALVQSIELLTTEHY